MKLSLCLIVKPTKEEAKLLDRCLSYVSDYVDEICITQAGEKKIKEVSEVVKKYNAKESFYKWDNNFANARNFNFSKATGDYIFWLDADDIVRGANELREIVEEIDKNKIENLIMNYLYDFNDSGECTVKHMKTRVIKKGTSKWVGAVHEDFESVIDTRSYFTGDVEVLHLSNKDRVEDSSKRNLEIAKDFYKNNPSDPRSLWLLANANWGVNNIDEAIANFKEFVKESSSDDEKYIAYMNLASLTKEEDFALKALAIHPTYPNAYHKLAELNFDNGKLQKVIEFTEIGLQLPIPEFEIVVYNPRDYDYNPLMLLMKTYFRLGRVKKAVEIVDKMVEMFPRDKGLKEKQKELKSELGEVLDAQKYLNKARTIKDKKYLKKFIDKLPEKVRQHPEVCTFVNENFIKEETTGRDLVYYCGYTSKTWNPDIAKETGIGGSEEAVINISKELVKNGWNVTVYNNCGHGGEFDGVKYRPFWEYNVRDKQDVTILWRHPKPVDYNLRSRVFVDMHDVLSDKEFTPERVAKIEKVFVKSNAHKILFPSVPDDKFVVVPNGIEAKLFDKKVQRDQFLILNTSSADRHLEATLDVFEALIEKDKTKPWKLAWYYGWGVFDTVHVNDKEMLGWKEKQMKRFDKLVKEGRAEGGVMLGHEEIAKKYLEAGVFLYPTQFYEIDCISARKAQIAGCRVITSDFAALNETVVSGTKIKTSGKRWGTENTFGDSENVEKYVDAIVNTPTNEVRGLDVKPFTWEAISKKWIDAL